MTGVELLEKLAPLIPPTHPNLTRFHGVFAPTSRLRFDLKWRVLGFPGRHRTQRPSSDLDNENTQAHRQRTPA
jgi:hypothetical protein